MATKQAYIRMKIDPEMKETSERILHQLGLSTTEAIRLFLTQVMLQNGLPFEVTLPDYQDDDHEDLLLPTSLRQAALDTCYDD
ncbi:MAG: type II toxin-antitoxin system RelB/DinJ family antitoxin [Candidatus Babeliaceae bacterium]|nr:type II toxin-antitoxin system RelB/DinJ family antitoxin [Candidatus Babeliaceae bacterium]